MKDKKYKMLKKSMIRLHKENMTILKSIIFMSTNRENYKRFCEDDIPEIDKKFMECFDEET